MSEEGAQEIEIPGVWKLGWMLFMQPLKKLMHEVK